MDFSDVAESLKEYTADSILKTCPTTSEINSYNDDFSISSTSQFIPYACIDGKNPHTDSNKLDPRLTVYQTLRLMKAMNFTTPLPWTTKPLYDWFRDNVYKIRVDDKCEYSYFSTPNGRISIKEIVLTRTDNLVWHDVHSAMGLKDTVVLFVHEARHAEKGHDCIVGEKQLDSSLQYMGAWGVQYYLGIWMSHYLPDDFQSDSAISQLLFSAQDILERRFCDNSSN